MKVSERVKRLPGEGEIEVLARALALEAEGADIIHLEVGEPDFKTPQYLRGGDASAEGW